MCAAVRDTAACKAEAFAEAALILALLAARQIPPEFFLVVEHRY